MSEKINIYETVGDYNSFALLPTRGLIIMPGTKVSFDVGRKISCKAIESAMHSGRVLVMSSQKDILAEEPDVDNIYRIGTLVKIKQVLRLNDDTVRVIAKGTDRVRISQVYKENGHLNALAVKIVPEPASSVGVREEALMRMLRDLFDEYCNYVPKPADDVLAVVMSAHELGELCDLISGYSFISFENKQALLEIANSYDRAEKLIDIFGKEIEILKIESDIAKRVKEQVDTNQREFYLKEQLKAIQGELNDGEQYDEDLDNYLKRINALEVKDEVKQKLTKEVEKLSKMPLMSHEGSVIEAYLDTVLDIPFGKTTELCHDLEKAQEILDADHYGMQKVKKLVVEHLAVHSLANGNSRILCLVGPPGVGKTSIVRSIATAMNRNYARISLGGIRDEAEIRGHRRTYVGSMPGRIVSAVKKSGSMNPLILLDEIDKLCADNHGDPASALLEVLDSEQNMNFEDHYLDFPLDLSGVFFIATANSLDTIPRPLIDRMNVVELSSYLNTEKMHIARNFLVPKQRKMCGLKTAQVRISDSAIENIIENYTREAGVRELERKISEIMHSVAATIVSGKSKSVSVTEKNIEKFLGTKKYREDPLYKSGMVGIVNGLAWTSVGGELLNVEVSVLEGSGKIDFTGSLGDVMKESVRAAISYIRSIATIYDIDRDFYKTRDIHVHFPEGAVPKDGPSAGIAIATALVSALSLTPVKNTVAMTGEITLTGRVLAIGGLKEKTMAAYKNGIKTVIIPSRNLPDLADIDKTVYENIKFIAVDTVAEVFEAALEPVSKPQKSETPIIPTESSDKRRAYESQLQ